MFTGIIEKIGKVSHVTEKNISQVIGIRIDDFNSALGDSICINGVCLTVEDIDDNIYSFSISPETYKLSNFKTLHIICNSSPVHLREFPLEPDSINSPLLLIRAAVTLSDTNPSFSLLINKPLPDVGIEEVLIISPVDGFTTLFSDALIISEPVASANPSVNSSI